MDKQNETEKFSRIIIIKMTVHGMIQELQDSDDTFDNIRKAANLQFDFSNYHLVEYKWIRPQKGQGFVS